ncbi:LANO_0E09472g1_1 [Lachancea nothofagi CBS 11611]|uniref:inositol phosphorylceramide mannosyltransferase n=1 Tax=Lachancea nothofagi CBS 11611 TaxID=1266666 RepID=A0A1G4JVU4_9SACH|nr:LANO_0E09472g1_1 [Lachancea nothofagi CBS 11611]
MRQELKYLVYSHVAVIVVLLYLTFDLLTLAIDDAFHDALTDAELNPPADAAPQTQLIPKIIHQTYKTTDIPEQWREGQQRCIDLHPDYEYNLWTDETAREFIKEQYGWFLDTFDGYRYPIERADAVRYFLLSHYGGVYIDLDDGCRRKLDPLLTVPAFVRKTSPTGISNDVMGSVPGHPFFAKVMKSLKKYDRNWLVPYITIMFSTGPLFVSVIWKQYKRWGVSENDVVRILQPADYKQHDNSFFLISQGSSWHLDDANFIKSLAHHILACVVLGFIVAFIVLYAEYCFYCWLCSGGGARRISRTLKRGLVWVGILSKDQSQPESMEMSSKYRRLRKDSNLPVNLISPDLEENSSDQYADLSDD